MRKAAAQARRRLAYGARASTSAEPWLADNPAAVLLKPRVLKFMAFPIPATPPHGHVRIAMQAVGICGSDVHYYQHGGMGPFVARQPMVLGHEGAGQVVQVGGGVTSLRVGDRVALEPGVPCWSSQLARQGRYNLDPGLVFAATPPHHGMLCSFYDHPGDWCHKIPENVNYEQAAFCEPLSVGVHALRRSQLRPGGRVAVLGAGPIGLVTMAAARVFGALTIACTDLKPFNLRLASTWADHALQVDRQDTPTMIAERLCEALGAQPDVVIDACGFESSMQTALQACASGGRVVLVGMGQPRITLDMSAASIREVEIVGSFRYCHTYPLALELLATRRLDIDPLITHRFGWSAKDLEEGFKTAAEGIECVKVMFRGLADASEGV